MLKWDGPVHVPTCRDVVTPIVIPSYDLEKQQAFVWEGAQQRRLRRPREREPTTTEQGQGPVELWKICRATSAAPTYFPPMKVFTHAASSCVRIPRQCSHWTYKSDVVTIVSGALGVFLAT